MTDLKEHPDYRDGYTAAMNRQPLAADATEPFKAGWESASRAIDLLKKERFVQTGPGTFTRTITTKGGPGGVA